MNNIFKKRTNIKPYEYPDLLKYKDAIRHSYWVHTEFNFSGDVQDFKVNTTLAERTAIQNSMLAIAQIEVSVKTFWADVFKRLPKPEVGAVGITFAESEVRHMDAYAHLLEIMGLNAEFEKLNQIPAIKDRIEYLTEYLQNSKSSDDKEYTLAILLFSIFIEHISLFSQFLIISSFDKHKKRFKGIANAIEATSKEEQLHGLFGVELINIIRDENPEWFDESFQGIIQQACGKAYRAELKILDWIFENGELEFLPKEDIQEFLKDRFNTSLKNIGVEPLYTVDEKLLQNTQWFNEDILMTKDNDFFSKRGTSYNKNGQSITANDLF